MLSVITINYNDKPGLERTMRSVLGQSDRQLQWIVIDGASTDGSAELLRDNAENISDLVIESDKGIYDAMNKGIDRIRGDYVVFMNSGDTFHDNDVVRDFHNAAFDADIVYGNAALVDTDGSVKGMKVHPEQMSLLYLWNHNINHQSVFFKASCLAGRRYDTSYRICADRHLILQLLCAGAVFKAWQRTVADYDISGLSSTNSEAMEEESQRALIEVLPEPIYNDYREMVTFRDVDLAVTVRRIIAAPRWVRNAARIALLPFKALK